MIVPDKEPKTGSLAQKQQIKGGKINVITSKGKVEKPDDKIVSDELFLLNSDEHCVC
ncbi:MAG: hypothetical protein ACJARP_000144 [Vicingaceae bacterium]